MTSREVTVAPGAGAVTLNEPFVVAGTVHGMPETARVADPAGAFATIVSWCERDGEASGTWYLDENHAEPVTAPARLLRGRAPESRRSAHLVVFAPGVRQHAAVSTLCGEELRIVDVEWLPLGRGMPCERCLGRAAEGRQR